MKIWNEFFTITKILGVWIGVVVIISVVWIINPGKFAMFITALITGLFMIYCLGHRFED